MIGTGDKRKPGARDSRTDAWEGETMKKVAFGKCGPAVVGRFAAITIGATLSLFTAASAQSLFDGADPDIEAADGRYWLYPTGAGNEKQLFAWHSTDLKSWRKGLSLISLNEISWINDDGAPRHGLWAPDMVHAKGGYFFYYSVGPQNPTPSRIGVAKCQGPQGPCVDSGRPLVTGGNGFEAIDPAVFVDPKSGNAYLYAGGSAGSTLRIWMLNPDMMTIDRQVDVETPPFFTEGAFMHERNGLYCLSYSSGHWRKSSYQLHYATATTPAGPWTYRGKFLETDRQFKGPGHHAFLKDPRGGGWVIAYHRWEGVSGDGPYDGFRRTIVQPVVFRRDGTIATIQMK